MSNEETKITMAKQNEKQIKDQISNRDILKALIRGLKHTVSLLDKVLNNKPT